MPASHLIFTSAKEVIVFSPLSVCLFVCGLVVEWLGRWTYDKQVACSQPSRFRQKAKAWYLI